MALWSTLQRVQTNNKLCTALGTSKFKNWSKIICKLFHRKTRAGMAVIIWTVKYFVLFKINSHSFLSRVFVGHYKFRWRWADHLYISNYQSMMSTDLWVSQPSKSLISDHLNLQIRKLEAEILLIQILANIKFDLANIMAWLDWFIIKLYTHVANSYNHIRDIYSIPCFWSREKIQTKSKLEKKLWRKQ